MLQLSVRSNSGEMTKPGHGAGQRKRRKIDVSRRRHGDENRLSSLGRVARGRRTREVQEQVSNNKVGIQIRVDQAHLVDMHLEYSIVVLLKFCVVTHVLHIILSCGYLHRTTHWSGAETHSRAASSPVSQAAKLLSFIPKVAVSYRLSPRRMYLPQRRWKSYLIAEQGSVRASKVCLACTCRTTDRDKTSDQLSTWCRMNEARLDSGFLPDSHLCQAHSTIWRERIVGPYPDRLISRWL